MQQDGIRLNKLKEAYKKAITEILKEEQAVTELLAASEASDSFYSDSQSQLKQDEARQLFMEIKQRFSEKLKEKIRQYNLEWKLNNLDKAIKESRVSCRDIRDEGYIDEIFESYIVDTKEKYAAKLEEMVERTRARNKGTQDEVDDLRRRVEELEQENEASEAEYRSLIDGMEDICSEPI